MTDLQKQIEELEKAKNQYFELGMETKFEICRKALSIIKHLQDEADKYKLLWESACEGAKVIIAEQEEEIKQLKGEKNDK